MNIHKEKTIIILLIAFILIGGTAVLIFLPDLTANQNIPTIPPRNDGGYQAVSTTKPTASETLKKASISYLGRDGVYVVQYTDTGFKPTTIQIPKGKSVRFINMSGKSLRIFTDAVNDPKFTVLNESKSIGKGGTYTFSFDLAGLWAYHNENNVSDHANIVVY